MVLIFDLAVSDRIDPYATSLRWAMYAQFAVPGWAVRQLPLSFHKTALMLLDGLGEDQLEAHTATLGAVTRDPDKRWPSFEWAHAFERAWCERERRGHTGIPFVFLSANGRLVSYRHASALYSLASAQVRPLGRKVPRET